MIKIQQTIIVGLGSSGRASVEHFKRRVAQVYGELPAIKLLALDTLRPGAVMAKGKTPLPGKTTLGPTELIELPLDGVMGAPRRARALYPWLPERISDWRGEAGWLETRAAARLALHVHIKNIYNSLEHHFHQLGTPETQDRMAAKGFEITPGSDEASLVVIGGLGDTVGSGLLLDVTYLIHYLYRQAGFQVASTGLLFMPARVPPDPAAEACAYAALKELDAYISGQVYTCEYEGSTIEVRGAPFNRGCYLIDTRNEKNLTLRSQAEAPVVAAEWLLRVLLTPLKQDADEFASQGGEARVRGQIAAYSSLGLAAHTVPVERLIEWSANRFSYELITEQLLRPEAASKASKRLSGFLDRVQLRPDDLIGERLKKGFDGKPIQPRSDYLTRLQAAPYDQAAALVQSTLSAMAREILPDLKRQIELNTRRALRDVKGRIEQEIAAILQEQPCGGLSLAYQFVERSRDESGRFSKTLSQREAIYRERNQQQINYLNLFSPALQKAIGSVSSYLVVGGGTSVGLLALLALTSFWLWQGLKPLRLELSIAIIALIWVLVPGGATYIVRRASGKIGEIRNRYVAHLEDCLQTELDLALVQAANKVYSDVARMTGGASGRLRRFIGELQRMAHEFESRLDPMPLCDEIDFALQHSVLTPDSIDGLYSRFLDPRWAGPACLELLAEEMGTLEKWLGYPPREIEAWLLYCSCGVFAGMREQGIEELLKEQMVTQVQAEQLVYELQDKAAPLWTYDPASLKHTPTLAMQTFVGLERPATSEWKGYFEKANPAIIFEATGDPHSLVVTTLRRGMPLFGLRRLKEFRQHYLEALRDQARLLHIEDEMAIGPDLVPLEGEPPEIDAPTAFALGVVLGLIWQDSEGIYVVVDKADSLIGKLASDKLNSAILLGADEALWNALASCIQAMVETNPVIVTKTLGVYLAQAQASAWESARIERYLEWLEACPERSRRVGDCGSHAAGRFALPLRAPAQPLE